MSASLADERATPKPPSEFCDSASQRMVGPPAGTPAARSAITPKAV